MKGNGNSSSKVVTRKWLLEQSKQVVGDKDRFGS